MRQFIILLTTFLAAYLVFVAFFSLVPITSNNWIDGFILFVGLGLTIYTGVMVYRTLNRNFEKIIKRLAAEERALHYWARTGNIPDNKDHTLGNSRGSKHCSE